MSQPTEDDVAETGKPGHECRACLGQIESCKMPKDIFKTWTWIGLTTSSTVAAEMARVANVEVPDIEGYPRHICERCLSRLKSALPLIKDVQKSEKILKDRLCQMEIKASEQKWPEPIQLDKNINREVLRNSMDVEIKQEVISDEEAADNDMDNDNRMDDESEMDIKVEPEEIIEQPAIQITVNDSEASSDSKDLEKLEKDPLSHVKHRKVDENGLNTGQSKQPNYLIGNLQRELKVSLTRIHIDQYQDVIENSLPDQFRLTLTPENTDTKEKVTKKIGPPCKCENECGSKLSDEQRQNICDYYCNSSLDNKRAFIINFTCKEKRTRTLSTNGSGNFTYKYYLPVTTGNLNNATIIQVCKEMFSNTLSSVIEIEKIWKGYEIWKHKQKPKSDIVVSVCDHFKQLQNDKLRQLTERSTGLRKRPIKRLTFNVMYDLYRSWVKSTGYSQIAKSYQTYKSILLKNISQDHIQTLQRRSVPKLSKTQEEAIEVVCKLEKHIENESDAVKNENLELESSVDLKYELVNDNLSQNDLIIEVDNNENSTDKLLHSLEEISKESPSSKKLDIIKYDDDDENSSDSNISNFSDEFQEEIKEELNTHPKKERPKKKKKCLENTENDSTTESESSDEDFSIENIKKGLKQNNINTRNMSNKVLAKNSDERRLNDEVREIINTKYLLTAKRKIPTRDPAIIRQYCKYHGLAYETDSGKIIPKKVLAPPCPSICKKHCSTKIPEDQRQFIFNHFWSLGNKKKQMIFIRNFTERVYTTTILIDANNRNYSTRYFLPASPDFDSNTEKIRVCCKMFFNTIVCSHTLLNAAWKKQDKQNNFEISHKQAEVNMDTNIDVPQSDIEKPVNKSANKRLDPEQDNTVIDFVYRAMPFEEYMAHFAKEEYRCKGEHVNKKMCKKMQHIIKTKRNLGKRYMNRLGKIVSERIMGPACNCLRECSKYITEKQRKFLFDYFWGLGALLKQRVFVVRFTTRESPKTRKRNRKIREKQYQYYLPVTENFDGDKARVCRTMFKNTLAIADNYMKSAWKNYEQGQFKDERGKHKRKKNITRRISEKYFSARDHYEYLRKQDPEMKAFKMYTKQYPDGAFTLTKMYKNYNEWFDPSVYSKKVETYKQYEYAFKRIRKEYKF